MLEINRKLFEILTYAREPATKRERLLRAIQEEPGLTVREWLVRTQELGSSVCSIRAGLDSLKLAGAIKIILEEQAGHRSGPFCYAINQLQGVTIVPGPALKPAKAGTQTQEVADQVELESA